VFDAFSGSLSVSFALKLAGYRVAATDLNLLSRTFAEAYLLPTTIAEYEFDVDALLSENQRSRVEGGARRTRERLEGQPGFEFLAAMGGRRMYGDLLMLLEHLATVRRSDLPDGLSRSDFFDAYCPQGKHSEFVSSRGRSGRRSFFSPANARRLDLALSQLRHWEIERLLPQSAMSLLVAVVCLASEKVANTQGTWHDFPREVWDARALKPIRLVPPPLDGVLLGQGGHLHGREEDALSFAASLPPQKVAYYDPPYNFRQYTAYYHLPNTICRYPTLADPEAYFSELEYVRGQNMAHDIPSQYCSSRMFLEAMRTLIAGTPADVVVVSYFTGRNHWSTEFDSDPSDKGLEAICGLLEGPEFTNGSLRVHRIPRTNYASYGGYVARQVDELLLVAGKRPPRAEEPRRNRPRVPDRQRVPALVPSCA
jgi:adenine-specific DNA methylase